MPRFDRYIGIDYSGAKTPTSSLKGLRIFAAGRAGQPEEVPPPSGPKKYWTRRGVAEWIIKRIQEDAASIIGIDHAFSFPTAYFEKYDIPPDWSQFLSDFHQHWPTDEDTTRVDDVRKELRGAGRARLGQTRWRRVTDIRSKTAKSVFHFDVQGSVAKSTHSGIPWLLHIRDEVGWRCHFWPFDGWSVPPNNCSVVLEVYPALWKKEFPREEAMTDDQHDARTVAEWLGRADRTEQLERFFTPPLSQEDQHLAAFEGWILGVM